MKKYKSLLMVSAVLTSVLPSSLYAEATDVDDLAKTISHAQVQMKQPVVEEPAQTGWFSSFRTKVGNAFRWTGDQARTEGNRRTAAGAAKEWAKEKAAQFASSRLGIKVKTSIFNPIGNAFRWIGQKIKGGDATQTPVRVTLNKVKLSHRATEGQVEDALRKVAAASYKVDPRTASSFYTEVVEGMKKRGHTVNPEKANHVFVEMMAAEVLGKNDELLYATFRKKITGLASDKLKGVDLQEVYKTRQAQMAANKAAAAA